MFLLCPFYCPSLKFSQICCQSYRIPVGTIHKSTSPFVLKAIKVDTQPTHSRHFRVPICFPFLVNHEWHVSIFQNSAAAKFRDRTGQEFDVDYTRNPLAIVVHRVFSVSTSIRVIHSSMDNERVLCGTCVYIKTKVKYSQSFLLMFNFTANIPPPNRRFLIACPLQWAIHYRIVNSCER